MRQATAEDNPIPQSGKTARLLGRVGMLHRLHWVVLCLSLVITLIAWQSASRLEQERLRSRVETSADETVQQVLERMRRYEDALFGSVAALHARNDQIDSESWSAFSRSIRLEKRFPGINGIGLVYRVTAAELPGFIRQQQRQRPEFSVHPIVDGALHLPITFIEPLANNEPAVGLDLAFEQHRREASIRAFETGDAQITAPIVLVQDNQRIDGFLFMVPWYDYRAPPGKASTDDVNGLVYIPFVAERLLKRTLDRPDRELKVRISDGKVDMLDEIGNSSARAARPALFRTRRDIDIYGRQWSFEFEAAPGFFAQNDDNTPTLVLILGIGIDALLFFLFMTIVRSRQRAEQTAGRLAHVSEMLRKKASELESSNAELERFAYVASHDLKTPLRGITFLTTCIEEDLQDLPDSVHANSEVNHNLQRLHQQAHRMNQLIDGILEFAQVGRRDEAVETVDTEDLVEEIRQNLQLTEQQLRAKGALPCIETLRVPLQQVLSNLIDNAIKYHPDRTRAEVRVSARRDTGEFVCFAVSDNGNGIDERHQQRIFEVFQTLEKRDDVESTGVGLSIVRKSVESLGGKVWVESPPNQGATFRFTWPSTVAGLSDEQREAA